MEITTYNKKIPLNNVYKEMKNNRLLKEKICIVKMYSIFKKLK